MRWPPLIEERSIKSRKLTNLVDHFGSLERLLMPADVLGSIFPLHCLIGMSQQLMIK